MADARDQRDTRIDTPPGGTVQPGAGRIETTTLPGVIDTRMREPAGVQTGGIETSTALTNLKV